MLLPFYPKLHRGDEVNVRRTLSGTHVLRIIRRKPDESLQTIVRYEDERLWIEIYARKLKAKIDLLNQWGSLLDLENFPVSENENENEKS